MRKLVHVWQFRCRETETRAQIELLDIELHPLEMVDDDVASLDIDDAVLPGAYRSSPFVTTATSKVVTSCGKTLRRKTWASGFS